MAVYEKKRKLRAEQTQEKRKGREKEQRKGEQSKHQQREQKGREQRKGARRQALRHLGLNAPAAASASSGGTSEFLSNVKVDALDKNSWEVVTPASEAAPLEGPAATQIFSDNWKNPVTSRAGEGVLRMMIQQ